jgi:plasmid maintenance system antidote protein VapI
LTRLRRNCRDGIIRISLEMAVRLSMAFNTSAESRHIQQAQYDFSHPEEKLSAA